MIAEVVSLSIFFLPLALCGWMVGRLHRIGLWVCLAGAYFLFWLFGFAFAGTSGIAWSTIWLTAGALFFFLPAVIGSFNSELRKYRDERQNG